MALHFRIRDFFQPLEIIKHRLNSRCLDRANHHKIETFQKQQLETVILWAFENVPFYQPYKKLYDGTLSSLPILTKANLIKNTPQLLSSSVDRIPHQWVYTSGSSGQRLKVALDKSSNALEFSYYWRLWNQFGYHIGDRIVEFSQVYFQSRPSIRNALFHYEPLTQRLLINSTWLSTERIQESIDLIRVFRPRFVKALPSVLQEFIEHQNRNFPKIRTVQAVFVSGELLTRRARRQISEFFSAPVCNSYGQMERVIAAGDCPHGRMHLRPEYGYFEMLETGFTSSTGRKLYSLVGTTFYRRAMPLIRYDLEDFIELSENQKCDCGSTTPIIEHIHGRKNDSIRDRIGRVYPTAFLILESLDLPACQLIQEPDLSLRLRVVNTASISAETQNIFRNRIKELSVDLTEITFENCDPSLFYKRSSAGKFPVVVSKVASTNPI